MPTSSPTVRPSEAARAAFTSGNFPDPLRIKPSNLRIAEDNCRRCHSELTGEIDMHSGAPGAERMECTRCHDDVGHAR